MQVRKTKDQGLYNKPSAAVHPGALAAGILQQYNTIRSAAAAVTCVFAGCMFGCTCTMCILGGVRLS